MKSRILYILISSSLILSCSEQRVIPKDTLAHIYADIYLADQYIQSNPNLKKQADTLLVYDPIFSKYGYTTKDYDLSVKFYLKRSDKFAEIFEEAQNILKARSSVLEKLLNQDSNILKFLDSLEIRSSKHILYNDYYRALNILFFEQEGVIIENAPVIDSTLINPIFSAYYLYEKIPSLKNPFNATIPKFTDTTIVVINIVDSIDIPAIGHIVDSLDIQLLRSIMDTLDFKLQRNSIDSLAVKLLRSAIDSIDVKLQRRSIDSLGVKLQRSAIDSLDIKLLRNTIDSLDVKLLKNTIDSLDIKLLRNIIDSLDIKLQRDTIDSLSIELLQSIDQLPLSTEPHMMKMDTKNDLKEDII